VRKRSVMVLGAGRIGPEIQKRIKFQNNLVRSAEWPVIFHTYPSHCQHFSDRSLDNCKVIGQVLERAFIGYSSRADSMCPELFRPSYPTNWGHTAFGNALVKLTLMA
jgi:hypothetical protein